MWYFLQSNLEDNPLGLFFIFWIDTILWVFFLENDVMDVKLMNKQGKTKEKGNFCIGFLYLSSISVLRMSLLMVDMCNTV